MENFMLIKFYACMLTLVFLVSMQAVKADGLDLKAIQQSAEQGNALAQAKIGAIYYLGQGVLQDRKLAAEWMRKAADQGHESSQGKLL